MLILIPIGLLLVAAFAEGLLVLAGLLAVRLSGLRLVRAPPDRSAT